MEPEHHHKIEYPANSCCGEDDVSAETGKKLRFDPPLYLQRYDYLCELLNKLACRSWLDIGCSDCRLMNRVKNFNKDVNLIVGLDVDQTLLEFSKERFSQHWFDFLQSRENPLDLYIISGDASRLDPYFLNQIRYENSSLDLVSMIEVIEHLYPDTLSRCITNVFGLLKPKYVLITTPNREFNVVFDELENDEEGPHAATSETLKPMETSSYNLNEQKSDNGFRHWDHKFEWTRNEFETWCHNEILKKFPNYSLHGQFSGLGEPPLEHKDVGYCTQMALFARNDLNPSNSTMTTSSIPTNLLESYIKARKRLNITNRPLKPSDRGRLPLYIESEHLGSDYKLVLGLSYPFECYEFECESERNAALIDELVYLTRFMSRTQHGCVNPITQGEHLDDERLENGIELSHPTVHLVECAKLADFDSVKKFKLTLEQIVQVLHELGPAHSLFLTKSHKFVIFDNHCSSHESTTTESVNSYGRDENEQKCDSRAREDFSESDWDNENEEEKENERTMGENDEDAAFKLLNHSKTQEVEDDNWSSGETKADITIKSADEFFELEEYWDRHVPPPVMPQRPIQSHEAMFFEQFADVDDDDNAKVALISIINRANELKVASQVEAADLYAYQAQREYAHKLRRARRRVFKALNRPIYDQKNVEQFQDA